MFEQTFVDAAANPRKPVTVLMSTLMQMAVLCLFILLPLVYTQVLPNAQLKSLLVAPPPPAVVIPLRQEVQSRQMVRVFNARLIAPRAIPARINDATEAPAAPDLGVIGTSTGTTGSDTANLGILGSVPSDAPPMPPIPQPKPKPAPSGPVRVGGGVAEANLIHKVVPSYPALAKSARIQGTVEFTAIISKDGNIEHLQLIHGHPLLVNAAREAVLQWKYRPTLLNGLPVEVVTDITVNFALAQ